jgi:membrane dipeptidase
VKKLLWGLSALLAVGAVGFFGIAPGYVEASMNRIDGKPLPKVSAEAIALHKTLTIVDLHSDTLMWRRDMLKRADRGHMDLPRLQDGNVALQVFSSVTKTPKGQNYDANGADSDNITLLAVAQLQPLRTWGSLLERSLYHATKLDRAADSDDSYLRKVMQADHIDALLNVRRSRKPLVGAMLSIEGLQNLEGKAANLDKLYAAGFRMAGITHFFDNELAGSMHGIKKGGLTPLGRDVIRRMEAKGMIVDIAHCSQTCVSEILAMARRPVVSSHGGVQATCKVNRNLSDEHIRGLAKTGGVIGILVGIDHVALGSDYDGATTVRFDTSKLVQVTQALLDAGFSEDEVRAAMGGNALRVIRAGLVPMAETR